MDNLKSIATSFTPTTDLFDDGSEVSFVSYFFGMKAKTNKTIETDYYYPTSSQNLSNNNFYLLYNFDGMIYSMVEGRVKDIGINENNEKFVKIEQIDGNVSVYEGLDTIGVGIGNYVLENKPIGIASNKAYLKISIYNSENLVNVGEIKWKN